MSRDVNKMSISYMLNADSPQNINESTQVANAALAISRFISPQQSQEAANKLLAILNNPNLFDSQNNILNLYSAGFSIENLTCLSKSEVPAISFEVAKERYQELSRLEFSFENIAKIIGCCGSDNNVDFIVQHFSFLQEKGFTHDEISKMIGRNSGSKYGKILVDNYEPLSKIYTHEKLVSLFSRRSGSKNLSERVKKDIARYFPIPESLPSPPPKSSDLYLIP